MNAAPTYLHRDSIVSLSSSFHPYLTPNSLTPAFDLIENWVERGYFPGAALLLAQGREAPREWYWGNSSPQSVLYLASAGKWLVAATILSLVDSGHLDLEERASYWFPFWTDDKGQATIRQLLAHTAGYPPYQPSGAAPDAYQTLAESVTHLAPLPAHSQPGTCWNYGGLAMQAAGRIAELATGRDWETLFQERIARPLGMTDTHFSPVDAFPGHNPMLGGGVRGTLRDYARFLALMFNRGLFEGKRVLCEKSVDVIEADHVRAAALPATNFVHEVRPQRHHGIYGLGVWREAEDAQGRATLITSPGWAGTYPWIDRESGQYGVFLAHVCPEAPPEFNPMTATAALPLLLRP